MGDISGSSAVTRALSRARGRGRDQREPEVPTTWAVGTQVGGREQSLRPPDLQTGCGRVIVLFPAAQGVALCSSSGSYVRAHPYEGAHVQAHWVLGQCLVLVDAPGSCGHGEVGQGHLLPGHGQAHPSQVSSGPLQVLVCWLGLLYQTLRLPGGSGEADMIPWAFGERKLNSYEEGGLLQGPRRPPDTHAGRLCSLSPEGEPQGALVRQRPACFSGLLWAAHAFCRLSSPPLGPLVLPGIHQGIQRPPWVHVCSVDHGLPTVPLFVGLVSLSLCRPRLVPDSWPPWNCDQQITNMVLPSPLL